MELTNQELQLEGVLLGQRLVEGDSDKELSSTANHQEIGVVHVGVVDLSVCLPVHVNMFHL